MGKSKKRNKWKKGKRKRKQELKRMNKGGRQGNEMRKCKKSDYICNEIILLQTFITSSQKRLIDNKSDKHGKGQRFISP